MDTEYTSNQNIIKVPYDIMRNKNVSTLFKKEDTEYSYIERIGKVVPDPVYILDHEGKYLRCWGPQKDMIASRDTLLGNRISDFLPEDISSRLLIKIRSVLDTGEEQRYEYSLTIEGKRRFFVSIMAKINDGEVLCIVRNVTDLHREKKLFVQCRRKLENLVEVRTKALSIATENLQTLQQAAEDAHLEVIHRLASAAEFKDTETGNHIIRMAEYAALLGRIYGLSGAKVELIRQSSPMHDVGKIGIPDCILNKPGKLTPNEWEQMKQHTVYGAELLSDSSSDYTDAGHIIALTHHEKWDGSGYPIGLSGEMIPIPGRICAVSDVFDALTSKRPYKEAFSNEKALCIMKQERAKHFDPVLLDLFVEHFDDFRAIQSAHIG
ncbi:HD-GYP domain-containing protein [Desulfoplanes sp.]